MPDVVTFRLRQLAWRSLRRHKVRTTIAISAVAAGVTLSVAGLLTIGSLQRSLEQSAAQLTGRADLLVRPFGEGTFTSDDLAAIARLSGVANSAPQSEQRVFYRTRTERGFLRLLGVSPAQEETIRDVRVVDGSYLSDSPEPQIVLPRNWAAQQSLTIGDSIDLMTREGLIAFRIRGLVDLPGPLLLGSEPVGFVALPAAERWWAEGGKATRIALRLAAEATPVDVVRQLPLVLGRMIVVLTADEIQAGAAKSISSLRGAAIFCGAIVLFIGAFLIHNTLAMAAREQRREFGLLRAAGALPGQIVRLVVLQALAIGLLGSLMGIVLGFSLALFATFWTTGGQITGLFTPDSLWIALWALLAGNGVALLASLAPARSAARLRPVEALRQSSTLLESRASAYLGIWAAGGTGLSAVLLIVATHWGAMVFVRAIAGFGLLLSLGLLLRFLTGPASVRLGRVLTPWVGVSARLAGENLNRSRQRTGSTISGVFTSVALVFALVTIGQSARTAGQEWSGALFPGNYIVVSPVIQPEVVADHFDQLSDVQVTGRMRRFDVVWREQILSALAVEWPAQRSLTAPLHQGEPEAVAEALRTGSGVLLPRTLAESLELEVGEALVVETPSGARAFPIAGILQHPLPSADNRGVVVFGWPALSGFEVTGFQWLVIESSPDHQAAVTERAESLGLQVTSVAELREAVGERLSRTLAIFGSLAGISVLIGGLGIANTMVMNISERSREIAVLRAMGMTRTQVVGMVVQEALLMGSGGAIVGLGIGLFLAWSTIGVRDSADFDPHLVIDPMMLLALLLFTLITATLATIYPARRAAIIPIVQVMKPE